jgi:hypothetical protein
MGEEWERKARQGDIVEEVDPLDVVSDAMFLIVV